MLALPNTGRLSDAQRDGHACPWCGCPGPEVDLGTRPGPFGRPIRPWGCEPCVAAAARRVLAVHLRACQYCGPVRRCEAAVALKQLAA